MKEFWDNAVSVDPNEVEEEGIINLGFFLAAGACLILENMSGTSITKPSLLGRSKDPSAQQMYRKMLLRGWSAFIASDEFRWGVARLISRALNKSPAEARDLLKGYAYELCQIREILGNCITRLARPFSGQDTLTLEEELFSLIEGEARGGGYKRQFERHLELLFKT